MYGGVTPYVISTCDLLYFSSSHRKEFRIGVKSFVPKYLDAILFRNFSLEIELGGLLQGVDYDFLDVAGDVALNGSLDVSLLDPFVLGEYQQFDILSVGGDLSGTFTGLAEGDLVGNYGGTDLFITYQAGNGNDIALSTVPEPGTLSLLALGLASLYFLRRRRDRSEGAVGGHLPFPMVYCGWLLQVPPTQ